MHFYWIMNALLLNIVHSGICLARQNKVTVVDLEYIEERGHKRRNVRSMYTLSFSHTHAHTHYVCVCFSLSRSLTPRPHSHMAYRSSPQTLSFFHELSLWTSNHYLYEPQPHPLWTHTHAHRHTHAHTHTHTHTLRERLDSDCLM